MRARTRCAFAGTANVPAWTKIRPPRDAGAIAAGRVSACAGAISVGQYPCEDAAAVCTAGGGEGGRANGGKGGGGKGGGRGCGGGATGGGAPMISAARSEAGP